MARGFDSFVSGSPKTISINDDYTLDYAPAIHETMGDPTTYEDNIAKALRRIKENPTEIEINCGILSEVTRYTRLLDSSQRERYLKALKTEIIESDAIYFQFERYIEVIEAEMRALTPDMLDFIRCISQATLRNMACDLITLYEKLPSLYSKTIIDCETIFPSEIYQILVDEMRSKWSESRSSFLPLASPEEHSFSSCRGLG